MNEPRRHLHRDLQALRYLDALEGGDLEAVAGLWEEASRDPDLEQVLAEVDGAVLAEPATGNSRASQGDAPLSVPRPRRRWPVAVGAAGALAAACLLVVLAWPGGDGTKPASIPPGRYVQEPAAVPVQDDIAGLAGWQQDRLLDETALPPFTWPLAETPPVPAKPSIPADLLN
jgi:hypothetical protein